MLVRNIMTTHLVTVEAADTLGHAAQLFRQYPFHQLPVVRREQTKREGGMIAHPLPSRPIFEGLIARQDLEQVIVQAHDATLDNTSARLWQERPTSELMRLPAASITPTTTVATAARVLIERDMQCLPILSSEPTNGQQKEILLGLLTRSDILLALARALGGREPGTQLTILLPAGSMRPLARTLLEADELHIPITSILAAPLPTQHTPQSVSLRLNTINPGPLLARLQQAGIVYKNDDFTTDV